MRQKCFFLFSVHLLQQLRTPHMMDRYCLLACVKRGSLLLFGLSNSSSSSTPEKNLLQGRVGEQVSRHSKYPSEQDVLTHSFWSFLTATQAMTDLNARQHTLDCHLSLVILLAALAAGSCSTASRVVDTQSLRNAEEEGRRDSTWAVPLEVREPRRWANRDGVFSMKKVLTDSGFTYNSERIRRRTDDYTSEEGIKDEPGPCESSHGSKARAPTEGIDESVDRRIPDPQIPVPIIAEDWEGKDTAVASWYPKETVISDIPSLNMSGVEILLSIIPLEGQAAISYYPLVTNSPLPLRTTWWRLPNIECSYCSENNPLHTVVMPERRHVALMFVMSEWQMQPARVTGNMRTTRVCLAGVWSDGIVTTYNHCSTLGMDLNPNGVAFATITASPTQPGALGVIAVFGYGAANEGGLWQSTLYQQGNMSEWVRVDSAVRAIPPRRNGHMLLFASSLDQCWFLLGRMEKSFTLRTDVWMLRQIDAGWEQLPDTPISGPFTSYYEISINSALLLSETTLIAVTSTADEMYLYIMKPLENRPSWLVIPSESTYEPINAYSLVSGSMSLYLLGTSSVAQASSYKVALVSSVLPGSGGNMTATFSPLVANEIQHNMRIRVNPGNIPLLVTVEDRYDSSTGTGICKGLVLGQMGKSSYPPSPAENSMLWNLSITDDHISNGVTARLEAISMDSYPYGSILHTATKIGNDTIVLGAYDAAPNGTDSDLFVWCFTISRSRWSRGVNHNSMSPPPRSEFAAYSHNSTAVIIDGGFHKGVMYADMWMFSFTDLESCTGSWFPIRNATNPALTFRRYHAFLTVDKVVIMFGGLWEYSDRANASVLTEIRISASLTYEWRFIPFPQTPNDLLRASSHILLPWSANTLLLYGELNIKLGSGYVFSTALLTYTINNGCFDIVQAEPYFVQTTILQNAIGLCSYILSDNTCLDRFDDDKCQYKVSLTYLSRSYCLAGFMYNNVTQQCIACPRGKWSSGGASSTCQSCPNGTSTEMMASVSTLDCTPCALRGYCHDHGECYISSNTGQCSCDFGYFAFDKCRIPYVFIILGAAAILLLAAFVTRRQYRKLRSARQLTKIKLEESSRRIHDLSSVWHVDESQLNLKHILGTGGYGAAWLADFNDMPVVVKKLHKHCLVDNFAVEEFRREAEMMKTRRHRNIVLFLGAGTDARGEPFLVMEYIARGSLAAILSDMSVSLTHSDSLKFMLDTAKGMVYLHSTVPSTIHRDLKPSNLLVTERWVVKVSDFGTARLVSHLTGQTSQQRPETADESTNLLKAFNSSDTMTHGVGTLPYQSPEMLACAKYTTSTDVYRWDYSYTNFT